MFRRFPKQRALLYTVTMQGKDPVMIRYSKTLRALRAEHRISYCCVRSTVLFVEHSKNTFRTNSTAHHHTHILIHRYTLDVWDERDFRDSREHLKWKKSVASFFCNNACLWCSPISFEVRNRFLAQPPSDQDKARISTRRGEGTTRPQCSKCFVSNHLFLPSS